MNWIIENVNVNKIMLVSYKGAITSQCHWGKEYKQKCKLVHHATEQVKLLQPNHIQQNLFVVTRCESKGHKGQISKPYFWKQEKEKLHVNYDDNNDLLNAPKFITMIPYHFKDSNPRKYFNSRYHVTESYLDILAQTFIVDSMY